MPQFVAEKNHMNDFSCQWHAHYKVTTHIAPYISINIYILMLKRLRMGEKCVWISDIFENITNICSMYDLYFICHMPVYMYVIFMYISLYGFVIVYKYLCVGVLLL